MMSEGRKKENAVFEDNYSRYYRRCILFAKSYVFDSHTAESLAADAMSVYWERKAAGVVDTEGPAPKTLPADADRERIGREKRAALFGYDPNAPEAAWQTFAPGAEQFLKEHLFCDVFARGLLTDKERELCTVSMLSVLPGAEGQLAGHRSAAEHVGNAKAALDEAVDLARALR